MSDQAPFQIVESINQTFKEYSSSYDFKIKDCLQKGTRTEIDFIESEINLFELCIYDLENFSGSSEGYHQLATQTFAVLVKSIQFTDYHEFIARSNKKIAFLKNRIHMLTKDEQKPSKKTIKTNNIGKTKGDASIDSDQPLNDNLHKSVPYFLPEYRTTLLEILKSYFNSDKHEDLSKLITDPHQKLPILTFLGNGNKLPDAFKKLIQENIITQCNKKELEAWISKNFRYFSNKQNQDYTLKYLNDIISTQNDKCKTPILKISSSNGGSEKLLYKT